MVELRTLGSIDLRDDFDGRVTSVLLHAKRVSLLAYLCASYPLRVHRRDTLVALLWPELDEEHSRGALRQELYQLRRALGAGVILGEGTNAVGVDGQRIRCDVQAFEFALDDGRPADALALWHGEFLPGLHVPGGEFDRWLDERRNHLSRRAAEAARRLVTLSEGSANLPSAIAWGRRLTELAPYDEMGWRSLMGLLDRIGDRAGALAAYDSLVARLWNELEVEPSPETRALAQQIRMRAVAFAASSLHGGSEAPAESPPSDLMAPVPPGVVIGLSPAENQTGNATFDSLASRLTDRLAHGLASLTYISLIRGESPANAIGIVSARVCGSPGQIEVRTLLTESGSGDRILESPEPTRLADEPNDEQLDVAVERVLAAVHAHYDPRVGVGRARMRFTMPAWDAFQESALGVELFGNFRFAESAEHLRRAWELDHKHVFAAVFAGISLVYAGDPAAAEQTVARAMVEGTPLSEYERYFGEWLLADVRGRRPEAYRAIIEASQVSTYPATWLTAGREAMRMNRPRETVDMIQQVPMGGGWWRSFPEIWEMWGAAHHMLGEHEAELAHMSKARARLPDALTVLAAEVRARCALGQSAEVFRLLEIAETIPPGPGPAGNPQYTTPARVAWVAAQEMECHGLPQHAAEARRMALGWLAHATDGSRADRLLEVRLLLECGDLQRAQRLLLELAPFDDPESLGLSGLVAASCGDVVDAERALGTLERLDRPYIWGRHLLHAAGIAAALDRGDLAMDLLRRALAAGLSFGVELHALPELKPLVGRSDFADLLQPRG